MKQFLFFSILFSLVLSCHSQEKKVSSDELNNIQQARILIDSHKYNEAIEVLKSIGDKSYEANYLTGVALRNLKQYDLAEKKFNKVYLIRPNYEHTCLFLAQCMLKRIDLNNKPTKESLNIQNCAIKLITEGIGYNKDSITKDMLARYYATRGQLVQLQGQFVKAIEDLTMAINLDPQGDYYSRRAMSYYFNGQHELACKDFEKGKELGEIYVDEEINKICR
jgi:tetratricopeptide (TPR) repeat protein